jgi:hypothetical protein
LKQLFIFSLFLVFTACSRPKVIDESGFANVDTFAIDTSKISDWTRIEAEKDANNDSLMFIRYGLELDHEQSDRYWGRLKEEYRIYTKFTTGCIVEPGMRYYNLLMYQKMQQKYGKDFLPTN